MDGSRGTCSRPSVLGKPLPRYVGQFITLRQMPHYPSLKNIQLRHLVIREQKSAKQSIQKFVFDHLR